MKGKWDSRTPGCLVDNRVFGVVRFELSDIVLRGWFEGVIVVPGVYFEAEFLSESSE